VTITLLRRGTLCLLLALLLGGSAAAASGSSFNGRPAIAAAFGRFFGSSLSTSAVQLSVESGTPQLAAVLRHAASGFLGEFVQKKARLTVRVGRIAPFGANGARVAFTVEVASGGNGPYSQRFTGAAVRIGDAWEVAWSTACFVAESYHVSCPRPPARLASAPLPEATVPVRFARPTALGLLRPEALAVAADGSLLIVDANRNQVLRRLPGGRLEVVAGTGQVGFAGDGGPAVDAELDNPTALAVAPNGSVFVADTGNGRVRVIAADGTVRSLPGRFKYPVGLALAPGGTLYVSTATSVVEVQRNGGRALFVRGHGRFDQILIGKRPFDAFSPSALALDSAGDLYAFSNGGKGVFEFSRSGKPVRVWQRYANGLAEAPDGSVVMALHGGTLVRLRNGRVNPIFDFGKDTVAGFPKPGTVAAGFDPDGVAVGADGTIYSDTFVGNGWTNQTALAAIPPKGRAHLLTITSPLAQTLPSVGASGFPVARYPRPTRSCPSLQGLRPFGTRVRGSALKTAARVDIDPLWNGLRLSDRAWWPGLYQGQNDGLYEGGRHRVIEFGSAAADPYSSGVARACGSALVRLSLAVVIGHSGYSDQVSHLYFLDRRGHALLYWQHT
jgi:hypothetical protein